MMSEIVIRIPGDPVRKSTSRRIVKNFKTGKPSVIKSPKALAWYKAALKVITGDKKGHFANASKKRPIEIEVWAFHKTDKGDLSIEAVMDVLQQADVINDDRYVHKFTAHKLYDKENPHTIVVVRWLPLLASHGWMKRLFQIAGDFVEVVQGEF